MKNLKLLTLFVALATLSLTSCKKDPEDRIPGDWTFTLIDFQTETDPSGATETETESQTGKATFNEDGTGTMTIDGEIENVIWSATETQVTLQIDGEAVIFQIIENEKKLQEWELEVSGAFNGYSFVSTITIKLTK